MGDMMSAACGNADRADNKTSNRSGSKIFTQPDDVKHLHECLTKLEVISEVSTCFKRAPCRATDQCDVESVDRCPCSGCCADTASADLWFLLSSASWPPTSLAAQHNNTHEGEGRREEGLEDRLGQHPHPRGCHRRGHLRGREPVLRQERL